MQTFDSVCCDLVKNSNIVTVFSTYMNMICTRQQTGVILSLAALPPSLPLANLSFLLPSPFPQPQPTLSPSSEESLGALEVALITWAPALSGCRMLPSDVTSRSI